MRKLRYFGRMLLFTVGGTIVGQSPVAASVILSDNLTNLSAGAETATESRWLAASFGAGSDAVSLGYVTLLLANASAGELTLDLYTDGILEPGELVGSLTSPGSYSSELAETTFTADGLTLAADSTYWIVLKPTSGEFAWSWTSDNSGDGDGFQHTWGDSDDAGATWYSYDIFPTQFQVSAITPDGDTDADGDVDVDDLNNVRNYFGAVAPTSGDTDADGDVDVVDLNNVRNTFGAGVSTTANVPEPTTIALSCLSLTAWLSRRLHRALRG